MAVVCDSNDPSGRLETQASWAVSCGPSAPALGQQHPLPSRQGCPTDSRSTALPGRCSRVHRSPPYKRLHMGPAGLCSTAAVTTALTMCVMASGLSSRLVGQPAIPLHQGQPDIGCNATGMACYYPGSSLLPSAGALQSEAGGKRRRCEHGVVGMQGGHLQLRSSDPSGNVSGSGLQGPLASAMQDDGSSPLSSSSAFRIQAFTPPHDLEEASSGLAAAGSKRSLGCLQQQQQLWGSVEQQPPGQQPAATSRRVLHAVRSGQQQQQQQLLMTQQQATLAAQAAQRASAAAAAAAGARLAQPTQAASMSQTDPLALSSYLSSQPSIISQQQQYYLARAGPGSLTASQQQQQQHSNVLAQLQPLQQLQQQLIQAKKQQLLLRAARSSGTAHLLQQHQQRQQQQQQLLAVAAAAAAAAPPNGATRSSSSRSGLLRVPRPAAALPQYSLLSWAGGVLSCSCHSAYQLAQSMWSRVDGRLDELLLLSLGVAVPSSQAGLLVTLWIASKLEGQRRQVVGTSRLATTLKLLPWAVTSIELHIMQLLQWRPYALPPATVTEL